MSCIASSTLLEPWLCPLRVRPGVGVRLDRSGRSLGSPLAIVTVVGSTDCDDALAGATVNVGSELGLLKFCLVQACHVSI
jgi:hypothetical protein